MQTPLDSFHAALVNSLRRREAEGTSRRRRRMGVTDPAEGLRVVFHIPANLIDLPPWRNVAVFDGQSGTITHISTGGTVATVRFGGGPGGSVSVPLLALDMAYPPPGGTSIEEIEAWLAS